MIKQNELNKFYKTNIERLNKNFRSCRWGPWSPSVHAGQCCSFPHEVEQRFSGARVCKHLHQPLRNHTQSFKTLRPQETLQPLLHLKQPGSPAGGVGCAPFRTLLLFAVTILFMFLGCLWDICSFAFSFLTKHRFASRIHW